MVLTQSLPGEDHRASLRYRDGVERTRATGSYFSYVNHVVLMLTSLNLQIYEKHAEFVSKQGQLQPRFHSKTRGPFLEGPEKFSDPESHNKNLQP